MILFGIGKKNMNISVLPSNLSSSIQLMDQKVISTFEVYYCRQIFGQVIDDTTIHVISQDELWGGNITKLAMEVT